MHGVFPRIPSGCAVSGIMSKKGRRTSGEDIIKSIALMHDRSNGLGGGFAAYGIYPQYKDHYAFHLMYDTEESKKETEKYLEQYFLIDQSQPIPVRKTPGITNQPILWRYFLHFKKEVLLNTDETIEEEDFIVSVVMCINQKICGAFVASSGKNMGAFKGVGYPEDIGNFYRLDEYEAYIWTAHGRFPTNTPGWWGGAHPFTLLDFSVVHNGEISSYGINKRYLEMFGYKCALQTDTEVVAYLIDLMARRHKLPPETIFQALAAPFWKNIDKMEPREQEIIKALRMVYGSSLLNGPFSIIVANRNGMIGFNDRIKLRPMVAAEKEDMLYMASEESAIRIICPEPEKVWTVKAGEPLVGILEEGVI